ncbi:MAG TPA: hypothetical protein VN281_17895 [Verrucomicrobiae bacterium]|nr:hypothetical protein [Verrucomicrobiae bacterium]
MSLGRLLAAGKSLIGIKEKSGRYQMRPAALLPKFVSDKNPFRNPPADDTGKPEPQKAEPAGRRRAHGSTTVESPVAEPAKPQMPRPRTARQITPSLFDPVAPRNEPPLPSAPEVKHVIEPVGVTAHPGEIVLEKVPESRGLETQPVKASTPRPRTGPSKTAEPHVTRPLPAPAKPRVSLGTRLKKLNPLTNLFARKPAVASAKPRRERLPEQAELSLERVIPVRNDLSDTDLEIRTTRPAKPARAAKVEEAVPQAARANTPVLAGPVEETSAWGRLSSRWFGAGQTTHAHTH